MSTYARSATPVPAPGEYSRLKHKAGDVVRIGCSCGHVYGRLASNVGTLLCPKCGLADLAPTFSDWDEPRTDVKFPDRGLHP